MPVQPDSNTREVPDGLDGFLIPVNLCSPSSALVMVLLAELLSLCLVLFSSGAEFDWASLGLTSLYVQWVVLASAAGLCFLRSRLQLFQQVTGIILCLLWILAVSLLLSLVAEEIAAWGLLGVEQGMTRVARNLLLSLVIAGVVLRFFYLQGELVRRQQTELRARIESLQARIRPHFLFNSMNSIASLVAEDPEAAEHAIENLAELFRASLRENSTMTRLTEELRLCRRYLEIEKLRLGARLVVEWDLGEIPDRAAIPPLTLQPLVENAVYHGVQPRPDGGTVSIAVICDEKQIKIDIRNPSSPDETGQKGNRMALANITDRLQAIYGDRASFDTSNDANFFAVSLVLPLAEA